MASGDFQRKIGNWATVQASASTGDGLVLASAANDIATAIPGEQLHATVDFRSVVAGTVNGGFLSVYKQPVGAPAPSATYEQIPVGNMTLDSSAATYTLYGVVNDDPAAKYYVQNNTGGTVTLDLQVRGSNYGVEP